MTTPISRVLATNESITSKYAQREVSAIIQPFSGTAFPPLAIIVDNIILNVDRNIGLRLESLPHLGLSNAKYWELKQFFEEPIVFAALKISLKKNPNLILITSPKSLPYCYICLAFFEIML